MSAAPSMLLTIEEAAARLSLSRSSVYELIAAGELKTLHYGRAHRIQPEELIAWIERNSKTADENRP